MILYLCSFIFNRAYRTALCKSKRGGFKDTHPDDLLAPVLKVCFLVFEVSGMIYCHKKKYNLFFFFTHLVYYSLTWVLCRHWLRKPISTQVKLGTLSLVVFWHQGPKELVNAGWLHFMLVSLVIPPVYYSLQAFDIFWFFNC